MDLETVRQILDSKIDELRDKYRKLMLEEPIDMATRRELLAVYCELVELRDMINKS